MEGKDRKKLQKFLGSKDKKTDGRNKRVKNIEKKMCSAPEGKNKKYTKERTGKNVKTFLDQKVKRRKEGINK